MPQTAPPRLSEHEERCLINQTDAQRADEREHGHLAETKAWQGCLVDQPRSGASRFAQGWPWPLGDHTAAVMRQPRRILSAPQVTLPECLSP